MGIYSPLYKVQKQLLLYSVAKIKNCITILCYKTIYFKRKYMIWDHFFIVSFTHALKPFFCALSKTPRSQSLNCFLCLFTLPEALRLLKTCLFTSGAQQVFEQSARWKCGSNRYYETHLLKCSQFSQQKNMQYALRLGCATVCPPH